MFCVLESGSLMVGASCRAGCLGVGGCFLGPRPGAGGYASAWSECLGPPHAGFILGDVGRGVAPRGWTLGPLGRVQRAPAEPLDTRESEKKHHHLPARAPHPRRAPANKSARGHEWNPGVRKTSLGGPRPALDAPQQGRDPTTRIPGPLGPTLERTLTARIGPDKSHCGTKPTRQKTSPK